MPDDELLAVDVGSALERKQQAAVQDHASQWTLSPLHLSGGWQAWAIEHFRCVRPAGAGVPTGGDPVADLA